MTDDMIKVYASETVEGLVTAEPLADGVEVKDRKSAVKVTVEVSPPTPDTQFFRIGFATESRCPPPASSVLPRVGYTIP